MPKWGPCTIPPGLVMRLSPCPLAEVAWRKRQEEERKRAKEERRKAKAAAAAAGEGAAPAKPAVPATPVAFLFPGQGSQAVGMLKVGRLGRVAEGALWALPPSLAFLFSAFVVAFICCCRAARCGLGNPWPGRVACTGCCG